MGGDGFGGFGCFFGFGEEVNLCLDVYNAIFLIVIYPTSSELIASIQSISELFWQ